MPSETLLLIDDDRTVHAAVDRELAGRVERILHAHEPEEGLRLALHEPPDVILLDLNLPRMDGLKLCRHLKEAPATRDVPILFLTVDQRVQHLARALEAGGADYIRKPFDPVELRARVEAALRLHRMIDLLRDQAWIDPLTSLKNRAALDDALGAASAACERVGQPASLLLLDVDHFKEVNDRHGHGVGDELLRRVAAAIRRGSRPYDTACRYGGDEFAVVYAQTDAAGAVCAAARAVEAVAAIEIQTEAGPLRATCSAGLACTDELEISFVPDDWLKAADAALYDAKRLGRNRLEIHRRR
jgi:diguanylate cyclase (GGDEF)-like protein